MSVSLSSFVALDTAVLLVLLPAEPFGQRALGVPEAAEIRALQARLGSFIRVLTIEEASYPAVFQSFGTPSLPACVLVHRGVELWRQPGLPDESGIAQLLAAAQAAKD